MKITIEPEEGDKAERRSWFGVTEFAIVGTMMTSGIPSEFAASHSSNADGPFSLMGKLHALIERLRVWVTPHGQRPA